MFVTPDQMSEKQTAFISDYFDKVLFPVLTPLAVDRSRPFPFLANKSLNLAVRLKSKNPRNPILRSCRFRVFFPGF